MRVKCYSVRLECLTAISGKALKAVAFDGSSAIIPTSQYYGGDFEVSKSCAYWISAWILEKVHIQYSSKKVAWFDSQTKKMLPSYTVEKFTPEYKKPVASNEIASLRSTESQITS